MSRRTVRDLRCPACARVFKNELVRHDENGDPPATTRCPSCKGVARVLPVVAVNFVGTTWSNEEARSRQVYGEDGMREGKRVGQNRGDYERALEEQNLRPATEREAKLALEKAGDTGSTFKRLRAEGDDQGVRRQHLDEVAERNGATAETRRGMDISDKIRLGGAGPGGFALPPEAQKEIDSDTGIGWTPQTADRRWSGVLAPDPHEHLGAKG